MIRVIFQGFAALALMCGSSLAAQQHEEHGGHGEQLGRVQFATSCPGAAHRGVEQGVAYLALSPNRARSLFGLARSAQLAGDSATAQAKYRFLRLMTKADGGRPEIAQRAAAGR